MYNHLHEWGHPSNTTTCISRRGKTLKASTPVFIFLIPKATMSQQEAFWVQTEDWHTAGEPFRIVSDLPPHCTTTGNTVWERRLNIINQPNHPLDLLRKSLCHEPRGHADMYGGFIVPPNDSGAHFGVLFWHRDGFSTACGHGTIALGRYAVAKGLVESIQDGAVNVIIDVPSGRVTAEVNFANGKVVFVNFINVPICQRPGCDSINTWFGNSTTQSRSFVGRGYLCIS